MRYIDSLVVRDENTGQNGLCDDARLYYLADANFNVTALVDPTGAVVERYRYDPYGGTTYLDAAFAPLTPQQSAHANTTLYTGREYDPHTGLYYYRARYYHAGLGRFVGRDPIGFSSGDTNVYRYVGGRPIQAVDPLGLKKEQVEYDDVTTVPVPSNDCGVIAKRKSAGDVFVRDRSRWEYQPWAPPIR